MIVESNKQPKIKVSRTPIDWAIEFAALLFLIILVALPVYYLFDLPETIPVHFNMAGEPDGYGSRLTLLLLPATGAILYTGMTILEAYPHIYNYPFAITNENAFRQYVLATRLIRILKSLILISFSYIVYGSIKTAMGESAGLGKVFLPVFLILIFGAIVIYIFSSMNNRH